MTVNTSSSISRRTLGTGLGVGATLIGMMLAQVFPPGGALLLAFAGLPAVLIGMAWGSGWLGAYVVVLTGVAAGVVGPLAAVAIIPLLLLPAGLLVLALRAGRSPFEAIGIALAIGTAITSLLWLLSPLAGPTGVAIWKTGDRVLAISDEMARTALDRFRPQVTEEALATAAEHLAEARELLELLLPVTFIFLWHLFSLAAIYLVAQLIAGWFAVDLPALPPFRDWQFDWRLVWLFIAGWVLFNGADFFAHFGVGPLARRIGANCLAMSQTLYLVAGFSLVAFFFHKYAIGPGGRLGLTVMALMMAHFVVLLGIIDVWAEFRSSRKPSLDSDSGGSIFDDW